MKLKKITGTHLVLGLVVLAYAMAHPVYFALAVLAFHLGRTALRLARFYLALASARAACKLAAAISLGKHRPALSQSKIDRAFLTALVGGRPALVGRA